MTDGDSTLMLTILREIRADTNQRRTMLPQIVDLLRRHDRRFDEIEHRISDTRVEIEFVLKAELLGRVTHFETRVDERIAEFEARLSAVGREQG